MHTQCTSVVFNFDYTLHGTKQLVERVIPKNKTTLTLSAYHLLAETRRCPQSPPCSGTSPLCAATPTGRLWKAKAYSKLRSYNPINFSLQNGDNNSFSTLVHLLSLYSKSPLTVLSLLVCVLRQTQETPETADWNPDCTSGCTREGAFTLSRMTWQNNSLIKHHNKGL